MDAAPPVASAAPSRFCGSHAPHELAEALALLLPLLPLDCRARAACVCRAWRAAAAHPALWEELNFERCTAGVDNAALAALCARAGAALRSLFLDDNACADVTSAGLLTALHGGGCTGLRLLSMPCVLRDSCHTTLSAEQAQQLAAACPRLTHATCVVRCSVLDAAAAAAALPGPLGLICYGDDSEGLTQLAECLRVNATLTSLDLWNNDIGAAGATQLTECLRVNATLTSLDLSDNDIGDASALRAACFPQCTLLIGWRDDLGQLVKEPATEPADPSHI